jgi:dephospho-CoA kinase
MHSFVVALTGGIASGKSATTQRLSKLGVPIFDADIVAHDLVQPGRPALAEIADTFGTHMLDERGALDRVKLRALVFADTTARHRLESILHPRIRDILAEQAKNCASPYCIVAIPLFVECRADYAWVDRVLVTDAPRNVQLTRLTERGGIDQALAARILEAQASRSQRLALANDVIDNTGPIAALDVVVNRLHVLYLAFAGAR